MARRPLVTSLVLAAAAAVAPATSGCAQILGFTLDYYDDSDSSGPPPPADGPVENGDALGERDGAPPSDGGSEGESGTFCETLSTPHTFCEDFDKNPMSPTFGFSTAHTTPPPASLSLDTTEYSSAPASLRVEAPVVMTANMTVDTSLYLTTVSGQTGFGGTLDWDMRVDQVDSPGGVAVLAQFGLVDGAGGGQYFLQLVTISNGAGAPTFQLNEEFFSTDASTGNPLGHPVSGVVPLKMWTHLKLSVTVPAANVPGTATLVIDTQPTTISIDAPVQDIQPTIGIGVLYASTPSNGWLVAYDNVVFNQTSN